MALVDDEDYAELSRFKWSACVSVNTVYAQRHEGGTTIMMHRSILGVTDKQSKVDHKDHNGLNNQRHNLRIATPVQNAQNAKAHRDGVSKFKGVKPSRDGTWYASIRANRKTEHLGTFKTQTEAAKAYDAKAIQYFGEFAHTNF